MKDMGKLNVGRFRSAGEASDVALMREMLEALERCTHVIALAADGIAPEYRGEHNIYDETIENGHAAITKLEERLLSE